MNFAKATKAVLAAAVIGAVVFGVAKPSEDKTAREVVEDESASLSVYRGIEPSHTEDTLPERVGFTYRPEIDLDRVTQDFIFVEAGEAGVDYELVLAIIIQESRCEPDIINNVLLGHKGAFLEARRFVLAIDLDEIS